MRADMFKVIVERPRHQYSEKRFFDVKRAKNFKLDDENDVCDTYSLKKVSMKRGGTKSLNENLRPLLRFLKSKIGYSWDRVYSEICERLDTNSTVKQHVRDHVKDFVSLNVEFVDGIPYEKGRWGVSEYPVYYGSLYVDHRDGILKKSNFKRKRVAKPVVYEEIFINEYFKYKLINEKWYRVFYRDYDESRDTYRAFMEVYRRNDVFGLLIEKGAKYAYKLESVSKKDLKIIKQRFALIK